MEAKEKALELFNSFKPMVYGDSKDVEDYNAKQAAIMVVDAILTELELLRKPEYTTFVLSYEKQDTADGYERIAFYESVKSEIENLQYSSQRFGLSAVVG